MGQLNSNDIPPNPFVHGWNEPALPPTPRNRRTVAREAPLTTGTPLATQRTNAISPLQRAHEIVSQPLPPARRPGSPAWPIGFVFAAVLIVASLILLAAVPHGQYSHLQTPAITNQVAANISQQPILDNQTSQITTQSRYSSSLASATPVSTPPVPVVVVNTEAAPKDSGTVEIDQPPVQTQISDSSSSESISQKSVPVQAQPPQNNVPENPVQNIPVQPIVIVNANTAQPDSRPVEVVQTPIQSQMPYNSLSTPAPQINVAIPSRPPRPVIHVFRTVGRVFSWPVVHVLKTVDVVLTTPQSTRYIYVYPPQQSFQINPGRVYYNQSQPAPMTTYQPQYQQRTYYNSQFAPQIRTAPNYYLYRPPNMMGVPLQQRRMR